MADIFLNKENLDNVDIFFDLELDGNDLKRDDTILTATLISIFTDASKPQIGTQIDGNTLGNPYYNIDKLSEENIKLYVSGLYQALQWLIDDEVVTSVDIKTEKQGNRLNIVINFKVGSENDVNIIFNLDENMEILLDNN
jgi:phage gp46-like protein